MDDILHFLTKQQMVEEIIRLDAALAAAPTTQPAPQQDSMFEFWWAEHMPEATQAKAWSAWNSATLIGGDEQRHIICLCPDCIAPKAQEGK